MKIIWDFVGDVRATKIVVEYDVKMVHVIFLLQVYLHSNHVKTTMDITLIEDDDMSFG
jgi:hypothetical protein